MFCVRHAPSLAPPPSSFFHPVLFHVDSTDQVPNAFLKLDPFFPKSIVHTALMDTSHNLLFYGIFLRWKSSFHYLHATSYSAVASRLHLTYNTECSMKACEQAITTIADLLGSEGSGNSNRSAAVQFHFRNQCSYDYTTVKYCLIRY